MPADERYVLPNGTIAVRPGRTWRDYFQYLMWILKGLIAVCLISNIVAYCFIIKLAVTADNMMLDQQIFMLLSNVGFCFICIVLVIAELEPTWFISRVSFLYFWFCRGFCYAWQGIQTEAATVQLRYAGDAETQAGRNPLVAYAEVVGYILIGFGFLYMVMSVLCIRGIVNLPSDQLLEDHIEAMQSRSRLAENLAIALGMSLTVARRRFGGDSGARDAAKFAKDQAAVHLPVQNSYVPPPAASTEVAALSVLMIAHDEGDANSTVPT